MPWDGKSWKHSKKANTPAKRRKAASVANSVLARGGSEGSAVRIANAVINKIARKRRKKR